GSMSASGSATTCAAASATRLNGPLALAGKSFGPRSRYSARCPIAVGSLMVAIRVPSHSAPSRGALFNLDFERRDVEHAAFGPAPVAELGELHALRPLEQVPAEVALAADVAQEQRPLRLERVVVGLVVRHLLPVGAEVAHDAGIRVPHRARRGDARLGEALGQAGHRRAVGAVD